MSRFNVFGWMVAAAMDPAEFEVGDYRIDNPDEGGGMSVWNGADWEKIRLPRSGMITDVPEPFGGGPVQPTIPEPVPHAAPVEAVASTPRWEDAEHRIRRSYRGDDGPVYEPAYGRPVQDVPLPGDPMPMRPAYALPFDLPQSFVHLADEPIGRVVEDTALARDEVRLISHHVPVSDVSLLDTLRVRLTEQTQDHFDRNVVSFLVEMVPAYPPTAEERERAERERVERKARREAWYALMDRRFRVVGAMPHALWRLHLPDRYHYCKGCGTDSEYGDHTEPWPCRTIETVAEHAGVAIEPEPR